MASCGWGFAEAFTHSTGGHRAGFFEFDIEGVQTGVEPPDAPARVKIVYGEVLNDIAESFDDYKFVFRIRQL